MALGRSTAAPQAPQSPLPKGQAPALGRPTNSTDPMPLFDFDEYFIGRWTFEWDVPEGPLGPDGPEGPDGPATVEAGPLGPEGPDGP